MLTQNDIVLANHPNFLLGNHISYNYSTVSAASYCDHWRNLRRIITTQILSLHGLGASLNIRREEVGRLLLRLGRNGLASSFMRVELKSTLMELTLNMMMRVMTRKRYYGEEVVDVEEAKAFRDMIEEVMRFAMTIYLADYLPVLRWIDWQGYAKRGSNLEKKMDGLLQGLVDEHGKEEEE